MSRLASRIKDKRVLGLIRRYLTAGVMIDGIVFFATEGTPRGGLCKVKDYAKKIAKATKSPISSLDLLCIMVGRTRCWGHGVTVINPLYCDRAPFLIGR